MTSWGSTINATLDSPDRTASIYKWVNLPNSTKGTGNISVILNEETKSNHTVHWRRFKQPSSSPLSLSFIYKRFSYWNGRSLLKSQFYPNGSTRIDYLLTEGNGPMEIEWFPYNHSFNYNIIGNSSIWPILTDYMNTNEAINWQSWEYFPIANFGDRGGWAKSLTINWNDSYQTTCHNMVDDDSGPHTRKLTTQEVRDFFGILLTILDDLIQAKMRKNTTTTVNNANTTTTNTTKTVAIDTTQGLIGLNTLVILLALIVFRRRRTFV